MHIVLVNRWYPRDKGSEYGGISVYNYNLAHALVNLGHRVSVIAGYTSDDMPKREEREGIAVHRLPIHHSYRVSHFPVLGRYVRPFLQILYSFSVARKLRELESRNRPDVIEFAEVEAEGFIYLLRQRRCPVIVRCHTPTFVLRRYYRAEQMPYNTAITSWMEKYCIRHADFLTAPSHHMAFTIAHECRIPEVAISVIPNALDVKSFSLNHKDELLEDKKESANELTVLHVGRLDRVKGIDVLAKAIPHVLKEAPRMRFVFIGDDCPDGRGSTWQRWLEGYFSERGVRGSVTFLGGVDQSTLIEWYHRADMAVVPTVLYESFSYTCAQAMAAGKPVVASRIGGIPETVDDSINGLLVDPGDVQSLCDAILELVHDRNLRAKMGLAGRVKAEQFDALKIARLSLDAYERVTSKAGLCSV